MMVSNATPRALRRERAETIAPRGRVWLHWGWLAVIAALGLSLLGAAAIATTEPGLARRQLVFLGVGVLAASVVAVQHTRLLQRLAWPLFAVNVGLLFLLLVPFMPEAIVNTRNGARRWINLGVFDLQPSELMKIIFILAMSAWLSAGAQVKRLPALLATFAVTAVPVVLIMRQPDLDTALLFMPTLLVMLLAAGARMKHVVLVVVTALAVMPLGYTQLKPHQRARVDALIAQMAGDTRLENTTGFQSSRAITLAGAGGVAGVEAGAATPLIRFNRLPEEYNDMIFAVVACRWGFLGGMAVWLLGLAYTFACFVVALRCGHSFGRLVAVGIGTMFFVQMAVNTGMTIGLLPVSGMTLPFVSYGGSSLISLWLATGVLICVAGRKPYGFDRAA